MSAHATPDMLSPQRKMMEGNAYEESPGSMPEAPGRVRNVLEKGKAKAVQMEEGFEHYVQAKPIQSVLIAAGAGLLIGYLVGKRR